MPSPFVFVPLDGMDARNLLSLKLNRPVEVIFRLEVLLDNLIIGIGLVNAERRGEILLLFMSGAQEEITRHSMNASHSPSGTIFWSL